MRFGSRSHEPEKTDTTVSTERDRVVRTLRDLADRIERAPFNKISESLTWIATTIEPLVAVVERAAGRDKR